MPTVVALPLPEAEMFETPSATVTFAGPAYVPVNSTILALAAVPAEADPMQTAATASIATALVNSCFLKMTPFVDVCVRDRAGEVCNRDASAWRVVPRD